MREEIDLKTEWLVEMLAKHDLSGVLLNGRHNFAWMTAGGDNGVDWSRENGIASVMVTRTGSRYLLASNIEMPRMLAEEISPELFEPVAFSWQDEKSSGTFLTDTAAKIAGGEVASDIFLNPGTSAIDGLIAECRCELAPRETERFRALGSDAASALDSLVGRIRPGKTELAIAAMMRDEMDRNMIEPVVTLVAADERIANFRHPVPTRKAWSETLLLVTCAKRGGLIASLSRMITVGQPHSELVEKTEAAAFVHAKLLAATRPGAKGADLYQVAKEAYEEAGFPGEIDKHHQGGAAGYRTREWVAHPKSGEVVRAGQAFAWNPTITGTKVEDTVILTEQGPQTITGTSMFPTVSHTVDGREYRSAGILRV